MDDDRIFRLTFEAVPALHYWILSALRELVTYDNFLGRLEAHSSIPAQNQTHKLVLVCYIQFHSRLHVGTHGEFFLNALQPMFDELEIKIIDWDFDIKECEFKSLIN